MLPIYQLRLHILGVYGSAQGMAMVSELSLPKPGGMCYRHNLTGPRDGPRATWTEGKHGNSLQIGFCADVSRARMVVYLRIV
jgi:hypothetical protein